MGLRHQALFNTLISSCVRTNSLEDVDTSLMFEVTCLDPTCQTLTVTFEHPTEETMATAELKLLDLTAPRCRVYTSASSVCSEETANKVLQRSLSIPVLPGLLGTLAFWRTRPPSPSSSGWFV